MAEAVLGIAGMVLALAGFVGVLFLGIWIDGRRQAVRNKGLHPVTTPEGHVESTEQEQADGIRGEGSKSAGERAHHQGADQASKQS